MLLDLRREFLEPVRTACGEHDPRAGGGEHAREAIT